MTTKVSIYDSVVTSTRDEKMKTNISKKIMVAMSGGVDSSVTAFLLKQQGYDVIGVTLRLWHFKDDKCRPGGCCSIDDIADAKRVCNHLGIKHYVLNMEKEFKELVVEDFVREYVSGRTPSPCIVCNEKIKFDLLLKKMLSLGIYCMATGHYSIIEEKILENGKKELLLKKGIDDKKDQSYFLYRLTQKELQYLVFPVGRYTKKEIRSIAEKNHLPAALKPESQEICFIDNDYSSFLKEYYPKFDKYFTPGDILDLEGKVIGRHKGFPFYTIGQRKGLQISSLNSLYVLKIDAKNNKLIVGEKKDVYSDEATVQNLSWVAGRAPSFPVNVDVKIRRQHPPAPAAIEKKGRKTVIKFNIPQMAITPGQSAVFYINDYIIGGGLIS